MYYLANILNINNKPVPKRNGNTVALFVNNMMVAKGDYSEYIIPDTNNPFASADDLVRYILQISSSETINSSTVVNSSDDVTSALDSLQTQISGGIFVDAPMLGNGTASNHLKILKADALTDGYLSKEYWSTFNSKQNSLTFGNFTESTSAILTIIGGTGAIIGTGLSVQVTKADSTHSGYLDYNDLNTFNSKQAGSSILTALAGLTYVSGSPLVRMTGAASFSLDNSTYLTAITGAELDNIFSSNGFLKRTGTGIYTTDTTVTTQGNTFNGANQLLQLNSSGQIPALDAHLLTGLTQSQIAGLTVNDSPTFSGLTINQGNFNFNLLANPSTLGVALAGSGAGNVDNGLHYYQVTFYNALGETGNPLSSKPVTVVDKTVNGKVNVTIPTGPTGTIGRRIYRSPAGGYIYDVYLVADIADNTTTLYVDNIADASLDGHIPVENSTGGGFYIAGNKTLTITSEITKIGYSAGANNNGYANTFLGVQSGYSNTLGDQNVYLGYQCAYSSLTADYNTYIGAGTGYYGTTANSNVLIGYRTCYATTFNSNNNVYIGYQAGTKITNTALGNSACIGYQAFSNTTTGNNNVGLGYRAGITNITGSGNVYLGNQSGCYETGSSKLFIDNINRASEADGRLKALIYGIFAATTANQYLYLNSNVQVAEYLSFLNGGIISREKTKVITTNTTLDSTYSRIKVTTAGVTITLPTAGALGKDFTIDNASTGNIYINTTSSQTIEGQLTQIIPKDSCIKIYDDSTNFRID